MSPLSGVGVTAALIAAGRAVESDRPDRLFNDPWAQRFVRESGFDVQGHWSPEQVRAGGRQGWFLVSIPVRTRFLDDFLTAAVGRGCRQVALLGAGLDTRALRMDWPGAVRFYELDTDSVLSFKGTVLADARPARAERVEVRVDLSGDWPAALRSAGFAPAEPTAWIVEGLLQYLDEPDVDTLMASIARLSAPGSELGMSLAPPRERLAAPPPCEGTPDFRVLWKWGPPDDVAGWLADYGWTARVVTMAEQAHAYGRALSEPAPGHDHRLVTAVRSRTSR